jgi:hypothetical protein
MVPGFSFMSFINSIYNIKVYGALFVAVSFLQNRFFRIFLQLGFSRPICSFPTLLPMDLDGLMAE